MPRIIPRAASAALAALAIGVGALAGCGDGQTVAVSPDSPAVAEVVGKTDVWTVAKVKRVIAKDVPAEWRASADPYVANIVVGRTRCVDNGYAETGDQEFMCHVATTDDYGNTSDTAFTFRGDQDGGYEWRGEDYRDPFGAE